ncbi:hypothetical protein GCM10028798_29210 [Humibacter antri]
MDSFVATRSRMPELENRIAARPSSFRMLTGERATGLLHLGHYFGSIRERVRLQSLGVETFSIAALCTGSTPEAVADEIGVKGSDALKDVTIGAVNAFLAAHRARRSEFAAEPGLVEKILTAGNRRANRLADVTMDEVRDHMGHDLRTQPWADVCRSPSHIIPRR